MSPSGTLTKLIEGAQQLPTAELLVESGFGRPGLCPLIEPDSLAVAGRRGPAARRGRVRSRGFSLRVVRR